MDTPEAANEIDVHSSSQLGVILSQQHEQLTSRAEQSKKDNLPPVHTPDAAEVKALKDIVDPLTKEFYSTMDKAATDPNWLPDHNHGLAVATTIPIEDGSGDRMYITLSTSQVRLNHNSTGGLDQQQFKDQVLQHEIEEASKNAYGYTHFPSLDLALSPSDGKGSTEFTSKLSALLESRMDKEDRFPSSYAWIVKGAVNTLSEHHKNIDALEKMHEVAVSLSKDSDRFRNEVGENFAYFHSKEYLPEAEILPGSVIDVTLTDASRKKTGEILASPDKPTEYKDFTIANAKTAPQLDALSESPSVVLAPREFCDPVEHPACATDNRAGILIKDINELHPGEDLTNMANFIRICFVGEFANNGADPQNHDSGIYALAEKLGAGIHAKTYITSNEGDKNYPYTAHIVWNGKDEQFQFSYR